MKYLFMAMLIVSGCSTSPAELMSKEAVISYQSEKESSELRDCILNGWMESLSNVSSIENKSSYIITQTDTFQQTTVAAVRISKTAPTKLDYYHGRISFDWWEKPVRDCR